MRYSTISIALVIALLSSCTTEEPAETDLVAKSLLQKMETFKTKKRTECIEKIYEDANKYVDSIIADQLNLDTISFPNRPMKPQSPEVKELPEDLELAPIKKK